jgi:hypothetical protein
LTQDHAAPAVPVSGLFSQPKTTPSSEKMRLMRRKFVALILSAIAILPWVLLVLIPTLAFSLWAAGIGH